MNLISILINNLVWLQKRNINKRLNEIVTTIEDLTIKLIRERNIRKNGSLNENRTLKSRDFNEKTQENS